MCVEEGYEIVRGGVAPPSVRFLVCLIELHIFLREHITRAARRHRISA